MTDNSSIKVRFAPLRPTFNISPSQTKGSTEVWKVKAEGPPFKERELKEL